MDGNIEVIASTSLTLVLVLYCVICGAIPLLNNLYAKRIAAKTTIFEARPDFSFDELCNVQQLARFHIHPLVLFSLFLPWAYLVIFLYVVPTSQVDSNTLLWMLLFATYATTVLYIFRNPYYSVERRRLCLLFLERQFPDVGRNHSGRVWKYIVTIMAYELFVAILLSGCFSVIYMSLATGESPIWMVACFVFFTLFVPIWAIELRKTAARLDRLASRAGDNYLRKIRRQSTGTMGRSGDAGRSSIARVETEL